ncbi:12-oxophytodienoate reductase [Paractinoplanes rhizophilus]|uniref:12-oxophytodienoate reductase n=1 Tax=Paractinoplanes rhizophilus TaxID=1416877 RepID=A0ABW2HQI4_9ACTN
MTAPLDVLPAPTTLAGLSLRSRFAMAPMTRKYSPGGVPTAEVAAYYRRRAEGGIGLIITEGALVGHPSASHETDVPRMTPGAAEAGWRLVTGEVHRADGRIAAQLWHLGSERGAGAWTPSTMRGTDFPEILDAYGESARTAVRAGFDAVEIHAAHGYLLDEFLWPRTNRRTDRYGGDARARATFPAEVIRTVKAELPPGMPLIVRFSQFKERDYAARIAETPAELEAILETFAEAGADVLHASQRRFWEPVFAGHHENLAGWAKRITGLPAITVGSVGLTRGFLTSPELDDLLKRRANDEYDLVALGRILLANPDWVRLAAAGRTDQIRDYRKADEDVLW